MEFFAGVESVLATDNIPPPVCLFIFKAQCFYFPIWGLLSQAGGEGVFKCPSAAKCRQESSPKPLRRSQEDHTDLKINTNICTGLCELNRCWMPDLPRVLPRDGAAVCQGAALLPAAFAALLTDFQDLRVIEGSTKMSC